MKQRIITAVSLLISVLVLNFGTVSVVVADSSVLIIDNSDTAVSLTGSWSESNAETGFYGDNYAISDGGTVSAVPEVSSNGYYKLYIRWPSSENVTENLAVKVTDGEKEEFSTLLDQSINGGFWVFAGTYFFTKNGRQQISLNSDDGKKIIFDAIRLELSTQTEKKAKSSWFEQKPEDDTQVKEEQVFIKEGFSARNSYLNLPRLTMIKNALSATKDSGEEQGNTAVMSKIGDEIIYDNDSQGSLVSGGTWKKEINADAYGGTYMTDGSIDAGFTSFAKWKPIITTDGKYELYMRWPAGENRPTGAKVYVKNSIASVGTAIVDQSKNNDQWNKVGEFNLYGGTEYAILLCDNSYGITVADAVKLKLVSTDVPPEEIDTLRLEQKGYTSDTQDKYNIVLSDEGNFMLTKNGVRFNINGACLSDTTKYIEEGMEYFVKAGGNMLRTYSIATLEKGILDYAYEHGLGIMAGISIPRSADTYADEEAYRKWVEEQKKAVDKFKNHPALVMWSVNNESERADIDGEVYAMIEEIARYIKKTDPYHPISTSFAGCNAERQRKLMNLAPSVDILGVNAYKGIGSVYPTSVEVGWNAPIMVTEYGPDGTWGSECTRTSWNVIIEQKNDEKADLYRERHLNSIMNNNKGIGGFAFCVPYAVGASEGTLTWYGFVYNGLRTPIMDEMQYAWTGSYPENVAPRIKAFTINGKEAADNIIVEPGAELKMRMNATDKNGDALTYGFEIRQEIQAYTGRWPWIVDEAKNPENKEELTMKAPEVAGYYRVYAYATDGHGNVGVDNIPIFVKPKKPDADADNAEQIQDIMNLAAELFLSDGKVRADITVKADENINGMAYTGSGTAAMEADDNTVYISSDVNYQSEGRQQTEVYIGKEKSYILNQEKKFVKSTGSKWYSVMDTFKAIAEDKNIISKLSLDAVSDEKYNILSGDVFVPNFYPFAISGMASADFITESDNPDAYSLMLYISKDDGRIEKAVATAGYMRSEEKAEYRRLQYTFEYDYDSNFDITLPE